jgi:hypothetical protein
MQNNVIVFTGFLADYLIERGEKLLHVRPDLKFPDKNVFVFEYSDTIIANKNSGMAAQREAYGKG